MKKEEAGRPVSMGSLGLRAHSEMMEEWEEPPCGAASVKTVMKVWWPSKNQAKETRRAWRNWERLKSDKQRSIVEPREGRWESECVSCCSDSWVEMNERRSEELESAAI